VFSSATTAAGLTSRYCNPAAKGTGGCPVCVSERKESVENSEFSVTVGRERKWSFAYLGASLLNHAPRVPRSNGLGADTGGMPRKPSQRPNSE
jgi:hypothetical protein